MLGARLIIVVVAGLLGACGPVRYASQVTTRAASEVEAADRLDAKKMAPYEATMAREYLHKAREEAGESRWERALHYGEEAEKYGKDAQDKAGGVSRTPDDDDAENEKAKP